MRITRRYSESFKLQVLRELEEGRREAGICLATLCDYVEMSRQNYYAARRLRQRREIDEEMIVELVKRERSMQPRLGGRKLLSMLRPDFDEAGVSIGRDRFFEVLAMNNLLVVPKPGRPRTTNSRHSLPIFHNMAPLSFSQKMRCFEHTG